MTAVVAAESRVAVQHERDVAVRTTDRRAASAAVQRGCDAAPVQEQDRLAAAVGDLAELGEKRRRERVTGLPAQVDDLHRRQPAGDAPAELEPLERRPALGPRRRRPEDRDGALERCALDRDRAGVVARIGLLLVGRVLLLVDDDQAEPVHRREDRRAGADDDPRLAGDDPRTFVAALGVGERRVQDRDPVAEAGPHAADRLRCERDLRNENDGAEAALEDGGAGLEVDLRLPRAGRAPEQEGAPAAVDRADDPRDRRLLLV